MSYNSSLRYKNSQSLMKQCGETGCTFLCLLSIAEETIEKPIDFFDAYNRCCKYLEKDFTVKDNLKILNILTGKNWLRKETDCIDRTLKNNEFSIAIYYNPRTGRHHYRRRSFDTLQDSITVKEGTIEKYYIYEYY